MIAESSVREEKLNRMRRVSDIQKTMPSHSGYGDNLIDETSKNKTYFFLRFDVVFCLNFGVCFGHDCTNG